VHQDALATGQGKHHLRAGIEREAAPFVGSAPPQNIVDGLAGLSDGRVFWQSIAEKGKAASAKRSAKRPTQSREAQPFATAQVPKFRYAAMAEADDLDGVLGRRAGQADLAQTIKQGEGWLERRIIVVVIVIVGPGAGQSSGVG
jgi:hypothetical protein